MTGNGNEYRNLVDVILSDLQQRGLHDIQADHLEDEGYPRSDGYFQVSSQTWYHPDIQARSDGRVFLYEVETAESFARPETREKIEALAGAARLSNGQFFLVVPEELRDGAQRLLNELHVQGGEVWGISGGRKI